MTSTSYKPHPATAFHNTTLFLRVYRDFVHVGCRVCIAEDSTALVPMVLGEAKVLA
jgi:hypothetical protein